MRWFLSACVLLAFLVSAGSTLAHTQPKARIALHTQLHAQKPFRSCLPPERGGYAPTNVPCPEFTGAGDLKTGYDVYLVVTRGDSVPGLGGVSCGLAYDGRWGEGIDILNWYLCADHEVKGQGPDGPWPTAGSGNMLIWLGDHCQRGTVPGFEAEGVHAVGGAFYIFAYEPDTLRITPNTTRALLPRLTVSDCQAVETEIQEAAIGSAVFAEEGKGCNPCLEPCAPIPDCDVTPSVIDFGFVPLGRLVEDAFEIRNNGPGVLRGIVSFACQPGFFILSGGGAYILEPGETRRVVVGFYAANTQQRTCSQNVANRCAEVLLIGQGSGTWREEETEDLRLGTPPIDRVQRIRFRLPHAAPVRLRVFDVKGRPRHLAEATSGEAGWNELEWDSGDLPSGMYFYRLEYPEGTLHRKFLLLR